MLAFSTSCWEPDGKKKRKKSSDDGSEPLKEQGVGSTRRRRIRRRRRRSGRSGRCFTLWLCIKDAGRKKKSNRLLDSFFFFSHSSCCRAPSCHCHVLRKHINTWNDLVSHSSLNPTGKVTRCFAYVWRVPRVEHISACLIWEERGGDTSEGSAATNTPRMASIALTSGKLMWLRYTILNTLTLRLYTLDVSAIKSSIRVLCGDSLPFCEKWIYYIPQWWS